MITRLGVNIRAQMHILENTDVSSLESSTRCHNSEGEGKGQGGWQLAQGSGVSAELCFWASSTHFDPTNQRISTYLCEVDSCIIDLLSHT